jgi:hypothetical protein
MIFTVLGFLSSFYLATWAFMNNGADKGSNIVCSLLCGVGVGMIADAMAIGILMGRYLF